MSAGNVGGVDIVFRPITTQVDAYVASLLGRSISVPVNFAPGAIGGASPLTGLEIGGSTFGSPGACPYTPNATLAALGGQSASGGLQIPQAAAQMQQAASAMLQAAQMIRSSGPQSGFPDQIPGDSGLSGEQGSPGIPGQRSGSGRSPFRSSLRGVLPRYSIYGFAAYAAYRGVEDLQKQDAEDALSNYQFGGNTDAGRLQQLKHRHDLYYNNSIPFAGVLTHSNAVADSLIVARKEYVKNVGLGQAESDAARITNRAEISAIGRDTDVYGSVGYDRSRLQNAVKSKNISAEAEAGIQARQTKIDAMLDLNKQDIAQRALDYETPDIRNKVVAQQGELAAYGTDIDRAERLDLRRIRRQKASLYKTSIGDFGGASDSAFEAELNDLQDEADNRGVGEAQAARNVLARAARKAELGRSALNIADRIAGANLRAGGAIGLGENADFEAELRRKSRDAYAQGGDGSVGREQDKLNEADRRARRVQQDFATEQRNSDTTSGLFALGRDPLRAAQTENSARTQGELHRATSGADFASVLVNSVVRGQQINQGFRDRNDVFRQSVGASISEQRARNNYDDFGAEGIAIGARGDAGIQAQGRGAGGTPAESRKNANQIAELTKQQLLGQIKEIGDFNRFGEPREIGAHVAFSAYADRDPAHDPVKMAAAVTADKSRIKLLDDFKAGKIGYKEEQEGMDKLRDQAGGGASGDGDGITGGLQEVQSTLTAIYQWLQGAGGGG